MLSAIKFVHFAALAALLAASLSKNLLLGGTSATHSALAKSVIADRVSGLAAALMVLSGIGLVQLGPRGSEAYLHAPLFWIKMSLLVIASGLILRTKAFIRRGDSLSSPSTIAVPGFITAIFRIDLVACLLMTALGLMIARGF